MEISGYNGAKCAAREDAWEFHGAVPRTRFVRLLTIAVTVAVLAAGCSRGGRHRGARPQASPAPVPTADAKEGTDHPVLSIAGIVAPLQNVAISSSLTEPADQVLVNEGDTVREGQTLAVLDTADLRANLEADEQNVEAARRTAASNQAKVAQTKYSANLNIGQGNDQVNSARAPRSRRRSRRSRKRSRISAATSSSSAQATSRSRPSISRRRPCATTRRP